MTSYKQTLKHVQEIVSCLDPTTLPIIITLSTVIYTVRNYFTMCLFIYVGPQVISKISTDIRVLELAGVGKVWKGVRNMD